MVSTLVSLHERLGDIDAAAQAFSSGKGEQLSRAAAAFFSRHGRWQDAAAAHQRLLDANPRDAQVSSRKKTRAMLPVSRVRLPHTTSTASCCAQHA